MLCYVNKTIATLYEKPCFYKNQKLEINGVEKEYEVSAIADEVLYGMPLLILGEDKEYYKVRTFYSYEGYILKTDVIFKEKLEAQIVMNGIYVDVLNVPKVQGIPLISLTRGCLVEQLAWEAEGYSKVRLLDGREGYVPAKYVRNKLFATDAFRPSGTVSNSESWRVFLQNHLDKYFQGSVQSFRDAVAATAMTYMGTQYRWGGKTPLGIDCSGATSMSYMLNGILTYRDAAIVEGYPVKEIPRADMQKGDLLYFKGHIAMYLGDNLYLHSTARTGSNGVDINSFDPKDLRYRKDLDEGLLKVGTIFW